MLKRYKRDKQYGGDYYEVNFQHRNGVGIEIDGIRGIDGKDTLDYCLTIQTEDDLTIFRVTDEEMQELFMAYLAVKQQIGENNANS